MHYSVRNLDTDEEHELKNIPAVLAFINANRKDKSKRNLGAKKFKTLMSGNGVFENHFKITKVYNKRSGKKSAKPVELAAPPAAAMSSPPMSDKPLPFKTRKSQKSNSGKAPMKEVLQAEETDVVMSEAPTANVDKLTTGDADPEGEKSNPVLKPQDKKKRKISPRQARNMKIGRAKSKFKQLLERRMQANGSFDLKTVKLNLEKLMREVKPMNPEDIALMMVSLAQEMKTTLGGILEKVVSVDSHPVTRDVSGVRTADESATYETPTRVSPSTPMVNTNRPVPQIPGGPSLLGELKQVLSGRKDRKTDVSKIENKQPTKPPPSPFMLELTAKIKERQTEGQDEAKRAENFGSVQSSKENLFGHMSASLTAAGVTEEDLQKPAGEVKVKVPENPRPPITPQQGMTFLEELTAEVQKRREDEAVEVASSPIVPEDQGFPPSQEGVETTENPMLTTREMQADEDKDEDKDDDDDDDDDDEGATPEKREEFMKKLFHNSLKNIPVELRGEIKAKDFEKTLVDRFMRADQFAPGFSVFSKSMIRQALTQKFSKPEVDQRLLSIWNTLLKDLERFSVSRRVLFDDRDDRKFNSFKALSGKGEEEEDDEPAEPVNPTSGEVMEVTGDAADNEADPELQPNVAHKLNAFNISQLGENTPEEYYLMRARLGTPMEVTLYARTLREFALNLLTKPLAKAKVNAMLREVASQNVDDSSMYVKYLNHLLFFLFENKVKLPANELEEIENDFGSQYQAFFGQRSESRDNAITSHIRMVVNEGTQMQIDEEPMVQEQLLEGSGALDFLQEWEKGLSTIVRSTIGQEIEKEVVAMQRMSRTHRRGHVLFDNSGSNAVRKGHYAPFKTPIDPSLRRPELAFQSPPSYTKRVPRIAYRNVGGPKRVQVPVATMTSVGDQRAPLEIPSQHPSGRPWASSKEQEDWYRNEAAKNDLGRLKKGEVVNSYRELANKAGLASRGIKGSGAVQQSAFRRKRGIALYAEEGNERQAHKRLRKAFTLSMYNEK
jgi:hypothetical protein